MFSSGEFSSGSHPGAGAARRWSKDVWNSARMDTAELNLYKSQGVVDAKVIDRSEGAWMSTYHESDPKFSSLGILKNVCKLVTPGGAANSSNIDCLTGTWGAWGGGYPPPSNPSGGVAGTTKEYTKIIPDGLLVPGAHVQYFFRKSTLGAPTVFHMGPDTNLVFPQASEASFDGHRWQQFGVLPDRWKSGEWDAQYQDASAAACMLYIDLADRRLDELIWVSIADSIGATAPARYGAHNGWHARGDQDITASVGTDPTIAVYRHGGQPGTIWDMYGVKASESSTTSSGLGPGTLGTGYQTGMDDTHGPTGRMLRYYSVLLILTADLAFGNIGPYEDKTSDDLGLITDFIQTDESGDTPKPRGVWAVGQSFMDNLGSAEPHYSWGIGTFGAEIGYITSPTYSQGNYRFESGYAVDHAELFPKPPIQPLTDTNRYSVFNDCLNANDQLFLDGNGAAAGYYPATNGGLDTWISSVYAPEELITPPLHEGVTLVEGFDIALMGSYPNEGSLGRLAYFTKALTNIFAAMCPSMSLGSVSVGGENPNLVNFLALRSENPHRGGDAKLSFGITRKEKVELKVYDVTGRLVKVLANREFAAGEHTIFWDGSDEGGRLVPRGVYFYQLRTPTFVSQKKLAVLRH
jgi:flagellar hook capping protein FlgD